MAMICMALILGPANTWAASDAQIEALQKEVADLRARVERLEGDVATGVAVNPAHKVQPVDGGWHSDHNWALLSGGMEKSRVEEILGAAEDTRKIGKFDLWQYGQGVVKFYMGRVSSWRKP